MHLGDGVVRFNTDLDKLDNEKLNTKKILEQFQQKKRENIKILIY